MKLIELEPQFLAVTSPGQHHDVDDLGPAHGITFLCPKCFGIIGGTIGTHFVLCWFRDRGVPDEERPGPARWIVDGTSYMDLTLSPSVQLVGGCGCHCIVTSGEVRVI
ncbi:MAG TPA: DUF6527 family protein [Polyangiaceae bacterium]|nr:DUF6527 family protein [Polyangiaceae bacterium]